MANASLRRGSRGPEVARLQTALNSKLRPSPNLTPDGIFGGLTDSAVRQFQTVCWLDVDGIAGENTCNALYDTEGNRPVLHNIMPILQPTATTCWAAATAMLNRSTVAAVRSITPPNLLNAAGALLNGSEGGGSAAVHTAYGRIHRLKLHHPQSWPLAALYRQLALGPMMMQCLWDRASYMAGSGSNGHWVLLVGMRGTLLGEGKTTTLRFNDPLSGSVSMTYAKLMSAVPLATYAFFTKF